jgi:uncharacterized protein YecE (DUF72 family)
MAWEPRGRWPPDLVRDLCATHDLIHCVNPFVDRSVYGDTIYWRLHGKGAYSYRYTDDDLKQLESMLPIDQPAYILFNNMTMKDDAGRFMRLLNV